MSNPQTDQPQNEQEAAHRSIVIAEQLRSQLCSDVESFLSSGGSIQQIEPNVMADPPKKPISNYGSRPI